MPVQKDPSGRRYVQAEVEVPGTPEEVWQAIASGPGISAWFVPTNVEQREGGTVTSNFGPGMDSQATITTWDPPRRFVAESPDDLGPDGPAVATEWSVETRGGGTCIVRVVHSWFASTDDWDGQFEGHTYGWLAFFRILRLYLTHFRGQLSAAFQVMGVAPEPVSDAWAALIGPLGLAGAVAGDRVGAPDDAPPLAGVVEEMGPPEWPGALVRLDVPSPGLAHLVPLAMDGQVYLSCRFYLYGDQAAAAVERAGPLWQGWLAEHFAPAGDPNAVV
jgi:uncharacterized protein YndB with AHSA1/START domain